MPKFIVEVPAETEAALRAIAKYWTKTRGMNFSGEIVGRMLLNEAAHMAVGHCRTEIRETEAEDRKPLSTG